VTKSGHDIWGFVNFFLFNFATSLLALLAGRILIIIEVDTWEIKAAHVVPQKRSI
jgi:hypothetical protein